MVKVSVELPPARIGFGENNFSIVGGARTTSVSCPRLLGFVPLSVVDNGLVMFGYEPALAAVTST